MKQITFSDMEYGNRKRTTKREEFLDIMEEIIPWEEWVEYVRPYYPDGKRGRPTKGIETMLRMYLLQVWFNLSDEGVEDAIYDSYAFRKFMVTSKNPQKLRQIEAFSIIGQILTCKQCFEKVTLP